MIRILTLIIHITFSEHPTFKELTHLIISGIHWVQLNSSYTEKYRYRRKVIRLHLYIIILINDFTKNKFFSNPRCSIQQQIRSWYDLVNLPSFYKNRSLFVNFGNVHIWRFIFWRIQFDKTLFILSVLFILMWST